MNAPQSTDLVTRLRETAAAGYAGWEIARDAADEIERLRERVKQLEAADGRRRERLRESIPETSRE